ncbi:MAG: hypothetical protein Q9202_005010 [Teloschistes flavicans]
MPAQGSKQVSFDSRYVEALLLDESSVKFQDFAGGRALLRDYSKIPEDQIAGHVSEIQRRAYALASYPCIGLLRFLICDLASQEAYPSIVDRLKAGATYLELGACFAQEIRQLAFDGAPVDKCTVIDLEPGFFSISHDLFRDSPDSLPARFSRGDVFDEKQEIWRELEERMDVIHASSFFHLFGLLQQKRIAGLTSRLARPVDGSLVLGLQVAAKGEAEDIPVFSEELPTFCQSAETMQAMWTEAGKEVGLEARGLGWTVEFRPRPLPEQNKVGLFANPKLIEVMWVARLTKLAKGS